jgi:hypothetical protein
MLLDGFPAFVLISIRSRENYAAFAIAGVLLIAVIARLVRLLFEYIASVFMEAPFSRDWLEENEAGAY